jgi:hypothetical protein
MKDPVDGTAQVVGASMPPDSGTSSNISMTLVVQAEGVPATSIEHSCLAPMKKWPSPGETLPVTFDRADPERLKVRWDDVLEGGDVAKAQADALAAQLNQAGGAGGNVEDIVAALQQAMPGSQVNVAGAGAAAAAGGAAPAADPVAQLERLAKLKESGALTEAEFEREKARILGS